MVKFFGHHPELCTCSLAPLFSPLLSSCLLHHTITLHTLIFVFHPLLSVSSLRPLSVLPLSQIFSHFCLTHVSFPPSTLLPSPLLNPLPSSILLQSPPPHPSALLWASSSSPRTPVMLARCSVACVDGRPLNGQHVSVGGPLCLTVLLL